MFKLIGSMLRWIGLKVGLLEEGMEEKNQRLLRSNPSLIRREGKMAKDELATNYKTLYEVIASKVNSRNQAEGRVKIANERLGLVAKAKSLKVTADGKDGIEKIGYQLAQLAGARTRATRMLLARASAIGVTDVNDPSALGDEEFVKHKDAIAKMKQTQQELTDELAGIETDLLHARGEDTTSVRTLNAELLQDRSRLREMERDLGKVDRTVEATIGKLLGAEEAKRRNSVLQTIDNSSAEARLANLTRLGEIADGERTVANEMTSGTVVPNEYAAYTAGADVDDELNALLSAKVAEKPRERTEEIAEQLPEG